MGEIRLKIRLLSILAAVAVGMSGCNDADESEILPNSHHSPLGLARAVIDGLAAQDTGALVELRVTREEHRDLLWDQLPESSDLPVDFAWTLNQRNSTQALNRALERYGGTGFEVLGIRFAEDPEVYEDFILRPGARLRVERVRDGKIGELPILGVVLQYRGRWKLMNYVD